MKNERMWKIEKQKGVISFMEDCQEKWKYTVKRQLERLKKWE